MKQFPASDSNKISGRNIKDALDVALNEKKGTDYEITWTKRKFKDGKRNTEEEINTILHASLKSMSKKARTQADSWMKVIMKQFPTSTRRYIDTISGRIVKHALDVVLSEKKATDNAITWAKRRFKDTKNYLEEEIESILHNCLKSTSYYAIVRKPFTFNELESDILECMGMKISDIETQDNVEVKKQMDLQTTKTHNLNVSLHSASHQMLENADYASTKFAPFHTEGWQFIKIAAILPGQLNYNGICRHCIQFLITGDSIHEIQQKITDIQTLVMRNLLVNQQESYQDLLIFSKLLLDCLLFPQPSQILERLGGRFKDQMLTSFRLRLDGQVVIGK